MCEVFPENFNFYRNDRTTRGGGVFIGVKQGLSSIELPDLATNCEIIWSKVKLLQNKDIYVGSFYMPHRNIDDIKQLELSLNKMTNSNTPRHILLAGDFNCPDIDWDSLSVRPGAQDREIQQALLDLSIEQGLTQIHEQPTRQDNILDLVFTNNPSLVKSSNSIPGISDHSMVVTDSYSKPYYNKQKPRKVFLYAKANWDKIKDEMLKMSATLLDKFNEGNSQVQELWEYFKNSVNSVMEENIPSKTFRNNNSLPWFDKKLKRLVRRKTRLYNQAKKTHQWSDYRKFQKHCKREFKQAEVDYVNRIIQDGLDNNNTKPFWKYIKSKRQDNIGTPPLKKNGTLVNDGVGKSEIFVDQFKSVFTKITKRDLPTMSAKCKTNISPLHINSNGVEKLLSSINVKKSTGPDSIPNIILKDCAKQIAPGLSAIFQCSIDSGELPDDWVNANISPIYKKGDVHLPENYRPVSLTSVSCKILEHIICKHLLNHLEKHKILTKLNHGFRSGFSCETQLLVTLNDFLKANDQGLQTDVIILDFSKAFDTVPHAELLHKLKHYGINGTVLEWLKSFLTKRYMRVVVEGEHSKSVYVESGVPQGTVLGPLLFLCHINDLPDSVSSNVRLFADDCLLYRTIKTQEDHLKLQNDLISLEKWASKWGMRFNAKKCYTLSINNKSSRFYTLDNHILQQVSENPYLGITLSEDLKWKPHIQKISKKANSTMSFLRRNLKSCPEQCKKSAYISLVRSILDYSAIIWDPYYTSDIHKLERIQRQAARFITGDYRSREEGCVTKMLHDLGLEPLQERRSFTRLVFFYKVVEGLVPPIPPEDFLQPLRQKRHIRATKYSDYVTTNIIDRQVIKNDRGYKVDQSKTDQYKNSFFVRTAIEWNHLENSVVHAETVEGFKAALYKCY